MKKAKLSMSRSYTIGKVSIQTQTRKRMTTRFYVHLLQSILGKIWYQLEDQILDLQRAELDK